MTDDSHTTKIKVPENVYELVTELTRVRDALHVLGGGCAFDNPKFRQATKLLAEREIELTRVMT